ncbi:tether containing UBX domain for GLUT4 [Uranotaenia lowii]|uniref:tether containing UBX domain for GLUT4 n=1 Tax=Uranotaenia lowii TaxID=190385 RepID=UPI00247A21B8|nr:tether containing UBX domain for GLUT4 [Uranotaenia lowii]
MTSRAVTVLTINGRRQNVKVEPNTTILEILETVCQKHSFNAAEYDLKHHNKVMDLSAMFRFSGLPNNAMLEMAPALKVRKEADVILVVQLEDGSRLEGTFKPSVNLLEVLQKVCPEKAAADSNPVLIYMRREVLWDAMSQTTLKSLGLTGGRAIIRLLQRKPEELKQQANVSAPLPQKEKPEEPDDRPAPRNQVIQQSYPVKEVQSMETDQTSETPQQKSEDHSKTIEPNVPTSPKPGTSKAPKKETIPEKPRSKTPEPKIESVINLLGERDAMLFHLETSEKNIFDLPDSFFEVTVSDVRKMYADLRNQLKELEDAPLMTAELRKLEENKRVLNQLGRYKNTILRIQFPDRYVLQGIFRLHETVADVMAFVTGYLEDSTLQFYLYTTPPKTILDPTLTLVEAKCAPQALLHFGYAGTPQLDRFLKSKFYEQLSNATGASLVAARSRADLSSSGNEEQAVASGLGQDEQQPSGSKQSGSDSSDKPSSSSRIPNTNFRPSSVQGPGSGEVKLPKWFKMGK